MDTGVGDATRSSTEVSARSEPDECACASRAALHRVVTCGCTAGWMVASGVIATGEGAVVEELGAAASGVLSSVRTVAGATGARRVRAGAAPDGVFPRFVAPPRGRGVPVGSAIAVRRRVGVGTGCGGLGGTFVALAFVDFAAFAGLAVSADRFGTVAVGAVARVSAAGLVVPLSTEAPLLTVRVPVGEPGSCVPCARACSIASGPWSSLSRGRDLPASRRAASPSDRADAFLPAPFPRSPSEP